MSDAGYILARTKFFSANATARKKLNSNGAISQKHLLRDDAF
jgi:hypothetical protein